MIPSLLLLAASVATALPQPQSLINDTDAPTPNGILKVYTFPNCYLDDLSLVTSYEEYTIPPTRECVNTPSSLYPGFSAYRATTSAPLPAGVECLFIVSSGASCAGDGQEFRYTPDMDDVCQQTLGLNLGDQASFWAGSAQFTCFSV